MQTQAVIPSLGGALPLPYGVGTIPDPAHWDCESIEEVLDLCRAITEITEKHEELGISYEWNCQDGWDYLSSEEDVISDYCEMFKGQTVEEEEELHEIFYEAALREYQLRPVIFSRFSLDEIVSHWRSEYVVGDGFFILNPQSDTVTPRVSTVVTEEEEE